MRARVAIAGAVAALLSAAVPAVAAAAPPAMANAVAVSLTDVRIYFNEPVDPGSVQPADFGLSMADSDRPVTAATVAPDGLTATISSNSPWFNGEAGLVPLPPPRGGGGSGGAAEDDPHHPKGGG